MNTRSAVNDQTQIVNEATVTKTLYALFIQHGISTLKTNIFEDTLCLGLGFTNDSGSFLQK